jgi:low affinity Fe/Cu permease
VLIIVWERRYDLDNINSNCVLSSGIQPVRKVGGPCRGSSRRISGCGHQHRRVGGDRPYFPHYSDTWQLVINTATTIVTFLMVFLIQNTQNRDSAAVQLKLDELIRAVKGAHNSLLDLEQLSEEELERIRQHYEQLAQRAREKREAAMSKAG